jgi:protein-tyrosine phosphatase
VCSRRRRSDGAQRALLKPAKIALGVGVAAVACAACAATTTGAWRAAWTWTAVACVVASLAYVRNRPAWLGKRDGRLGPRALVVAPYLVAFRIACALMRWWRGRDAPCEVAPGLWVAGRIGPADVLGDDVLVVDLVAEFPEPAALRARRGYRALPVLDGGVPPDAGAYARVVREAAAWPGRVLVHCDSGRGRAPTFAAAVLLARGLAADVGSAIALQRRARPVIAPTRADRAFLEQLAPVVRASPALSAREGGSYHARP